MSKAKHAPRLAIALFAACALAATLEFGVPLPAALAGVNGRLEELQSRRQELNTEIGEENAELRRMDGSSAAAEAEEQAQAALASTPPALHLSPARHALVSIAAHAWRSVPMERGYWSRAPPVLSV